MKNIQNDMMLFIRKLYPFTRSITGNGVRETLTNIQKEIPLEIHEVASGTEVFDWTIPQEWNIRDAYIKNSKGEKIIDFKKSNLHVISYSIPVNKKIPLDELKNHIHTLPDRPNAIPYRTAYYDKEWGFCMAHSDFVTLQDGEYEVVIDSSLKTGSLSYGEYVIPGETTDEVLISTHICHPSLCNDNLSGIVVATALAKYLSSKKGKYTYRLLFIPGTIGSLAWLAKNEKNITNIKHGLVLTGLGDKGAFHYKKSRKSDAEIDEVAQYVMQENDKKNEVLEFSPFGYDERQYCSPGFNLSVGCLMRSIHGTYPEYHTSLDNLDFISEKNLQASLAVVTKILDVLEHNKTYKNMFPKGEPQLGKRGLYKAMAVQSEDKAEKQMAMLWILNLSDGTHTLLDIAKRSRINFDIIQQIADLLEKNNIIKENNEY